MQKGCVSKPIWISETICILLYTAIDKCGIWNPIETKTGIIIGDAKIWKHVAYRKEKEKGALALLIRYFSHKHLTKLRSADPEPNAVFTYFGHGAHLTERSFQWRLIRRTAQRTLLLGFTTVDGRISFGAQGEGVVLIILHGYFICSSLIASLQER